MATKKKRVRRVFSLTDELLKKSREAALAAVQIFNNPSVTFKSETYTVLMVIAWTYLLHAHYRAKKIDYRYFDQPKTKRKYHRTKRGAYKYWELERCLNEKKCPLDGPVSENLKFLIGLRHEIEHQMTTRIDDLLSARFQACCINYHEAVVALFGKKHGIADHLSVSLQFAALSREQISSLDEHKGLPAHIKKFVAGFDGALHPDMLASERFSYRVIFIPKQANHINSADQVIEFVKADSDIAKSVNAQLTMIRETERPKLLPSQIVARMAAEGFSRFQMHQHTELWKAENAKSDSRYGVQVANTWYWYEPWLAEVRKHCQANAARYK